MVYANANTIRKTKQPGERLWGTAFTLESNKENYMLYQEPVLGELCCGKSKAKEQELRQRGEQIQTFVPIGRNDQPMFYKAVRLESRLLADTEQEAIVLFNEQVAVAQERLEDIIQNIQTRYLPVSNQTYKLTPIPGTQVTYETDDYETFIALVKPQLVMIPMPGYKTPAIVCRPKGPGIIHFREIVNAVLYNANQPDEHVEFDVQLNGQPVKIRIQADTFRQFPNFTIYR